MQKSARLVFIALLCSLFFSLSLLYPDRCYCAEPVQSTLYFYSAETSINNFQLLKLEFDSYFAPIGPYAMQPVRKTKDFESVILAKTDAVFLLSGWHFANIRRQIELKPVLVGQVKGKSTQRVVLYTKSAIKNLADLSGQTITAAMSADYARNLLEDMASNPEDTKSIRILNVPKDLDALTAVFWGEAQGALVSEHSLVKLPTNQAAQLKAVAVGRETLLPTLAVLESAGPETTALVKAIEKMNSDPEGRKRLKMIGLDGWKKWAASDEEMLK